MLQSLRAPSDLCAPAPPAPFLSLRLRREGRGVCVWGGVCVWVCRVKEDAVLHPLYDSQAYGLTVLGNFILQ